MMGVANVASNVVIFVCGYGRGRTRVCFVDFCCRQIHTNYVATWVLSKDEVVKWCCSGHV